MEPSQPTPVSVEHCKDLLRTVAKMMCVKTELISTRLLSVDDKEDMLNGLISDETLLTGVRVWIKAGMPDYANGKFEPYKPVSGVRMHVYRGIGKDLPERKFKR
jgi:hypothetical protein